MEKILDKKEYIGRNVFWFLIDGLSPNFLNICGNSEVETNYFDELLGKGVVFSNVASTGASTHTSMHSIFSSMLPTYNGACGYSKEALRKFDERIYTITDYFKLNKYATFRYDDTLEEREVPKSGFDVWESSAIPMDYSFYATDETFDCGRREMFYKLVNSCGRRKFIYHHISFLHDLNGKMGGYWDSSKYIYNIRIAADNFKTIIGKYNIKDEDIIVISSDHGVLLDMDFIKDAIDRGERHYEQSVRTFFAIVGLGINIVFDHLISALDEGPTIVDIILDTQMYGQGRSRWELIEKNIYVPTYIYREKGTWCGEEIKRTPFKSNVFYLRDGKWKYVYGLDDSRCEWLIDLDQDKDYTFNRKDIEEKRVQEYRKLINDIFIDCNIPDSDFLKKLETNGKHRMPPFFSLIIAGNVGDIETEKSLLDLAGPYYEIIYIDGDATPYRSKSYKQKYVHSKDEAIKMASGEYIILLEGDKPYSEYFLSDIYVKIMKEGGIINGQGDGFHLIHRDMISQSMNDTRHTYDLSCLVRCYAEMETSLKMMIFNSRLIPQKYLCKLYFDNISSGNIPNALREEVKRVIPELRIVDDNTDDDIIIYPCGEYGKKARDYFDKRVLYFADSDPKIIGHCVGGKRVLSPLQMIESGKTIFVAISTGKAFEIISYLYQIGCSRCVLNYDYL